MHANEEDRATAIHGGTAVRALAMWLDGEYRAGDEPAMLSVIRRETCCVLSDAEIRGVVYSACDQGCDATAALERIVAAERQEIAPRAALPPR